MTHSFDPGALLGASYPLGGGGRIRLRLAAPSDAARLTRLLAEAGDAGAGLQAARLIRCDPRRRLVVCAAAPTSAGEDLVGVGVIELDGSVDPSPDLMIVAGHAPDGVRELLGAALIGRAIALARIRAA